MEVREGGGDRRGKEREGKEREVDVRMGAGGRRERWR
jgi:hypothetical protein